MLYYIKHVFIYKVHNKDINYLYLNNRLVNQYRNNDRANRMTIALMMTIQIQRMFNLQLVNQQPKKLY